MVANLGIYKPSVAVGVCLADKLRVLDDNLAMLQMYDNTEVFHAGAETGKLTVQGFARFRFLEALNCMDVSLEQKGQRFKKVPKGKVKPKNLDDVLTTLHGWSKKGIERFIGVDRDGSLVPDIGLKRGDEYGGVYMHLLQTIIRDAYANMPAKSKRVVPTPTIDDIFRQQIPNFDDDYTKGEKTRHSQCLGMAAALFDEMYSTMRIGKLSKQVVSTPNIKDRINISRIDDSPLLKREEVIILNKETMHQDIGDVPPTGSVVVFRNRNKSGERLITYLACEYVDKVDNADVDLQVGHYNNRPIVITAREYECRFRKDPKLHDLTQVNPADLTPYKFQPTPN